MNARIKEIEIQSVFYNEDTQSWEFDRKKFAELIVKECTIALENNKANLTIDSYTDAIWEINEHFGLE